MFRVVHTALGTRHAMKVLHVPTRAVAARLLQEGQVQGSLSHPNVVAVTDLVDVQGSPGLVMEWIRGPSLEGYLRDKPHLEMDELDSLVDGILAGVAAAHAAGMVHRDLKPGNILLQPTAGGMVPKVTDFGLAKLLNDGAGRNLASTRSGVAMGSPPYMAPEQIRDAKAVDARADIFSLGAVLYELATGRRAFNGRDMVEIFARISRGHYRPVRELRPDLPLRAARAIEAALIVDADQRIPNCQVLLQTWRGLADEPAAHFRSPSKPVAPQQDQGAYPNASRSMHTMGSKDTEVVRAAISVAWAAPATRDARPSARELLVENGGFELRAAQSGAVMGVFDSPGSAVSWAWLAARREGRRVSLCTLQTPPELDGRTGEFAFPVEEVARCRGLAELLVAPGVVAEEALWSGAERDLMSSSLRAGAPQTVRLPGAEGAVNVVVIGEDGLALGHALEVTPVRTNLPERPGCFVGRESELEAIDRAFRRGAATVALIGSPAIGASRLAERYAALHLHEYADGGAWRIQTSELADLRTVAREVASVLGVTLTRMDPVGQVGAFLERAGRTLLVLDGLKLPPDALDVIVERWTKDTRARLLLCTREVPARCTRVAVGPLRPQDTRTLLEELWDGAASFSGELDGLVAVLDGNPLAVHLAVGWLHHGMLSPKELAGRIEKDPDFLSDAPGWQGERLTDIVKRAWALLSARERQALMALSPIHGDFSLRLAEDLLEPERVDQGSAHAVLADIVRHGAVTPMAQPDGTTRLVVSRWMRCWAESQLKRSGRAHMAVSDLAKWAAEFSEPLATEGAKGEVGALRELERERGLLEVLVRHESRGATEASVRTALALGKLTAIRGPYDAIRPILEHANRLATRASPTLTARAMLDYAEVLLRMGEVRTADPLIVKLEAVDLKRVEDEDLADRVACVRVRRFMLRGELGAAGSILEQGLAASRSTAGALLLQEMHGLLALARGAFDDAGELLAQVQTGWRYQDAPRRAAWAVAPWVTARAALGEAVEALTVATETLEQLDEWGDVPGRARVHLAMAEAHLARRDAEQASQHLKLGESDFRMTHDECGIALVRLVRARLLIGTNRPAAAMDLSRRANAALTRLGADLYVQDGDG